jgi:hypothetical protein
MKTRKNFLLFCRKYVNFSLELKQHISEYISLPSESYSRDQDCASCCLLSKGGRISELEVDHVSVACFKNKRGLGLKNIVHTADLSDCILRCKFTVGDITA